jgi:hypothetical protein
LGTLINYAGAMISDVVARISYVGALIKRFATLFSVARCTVSCEWVSAA